MKNSEGESGDDFARHFNSIRRGVDSKEKLCHASAEQYDDKKTLEEHREELIRSLFWSDPDGTPLYNEELAEEVWNDKIKGSKKCDGPKCIWRPDTGDADAGTRASRMYYEGKLTAVTIMQITEIDLDRPGCAVLVNGNPRMSGRLEDVIHYAEEVLGSGYK